MTENTQVLLKRRCEGLPVAEDFEVTSSPIEPPSDGQLLCETIYLSLDPYLRGRISGRHVTGSISPGELMPGEAICRVIESKHPDYSAGDIVKAFSGWQTNPVVDTPDTCPIDPSAGPLSTAARPIDPSVGPLSTFLGILGMPGLTAYAGLLKLGEPQEGDTVLVSAASGAVGSMVGQIAKIKGCRVVGIAGAPEKCAWVTDVAGFDDVVSYRTGDLREGLDRACPDGIDVYFDNVGGDTLQAAMERLALGARVVLCGLMAQYNSNEMPPGPNPAFIIKARATVRGLVVYDHETLRAEMIEEVSKWLRDGKIQYLEDRTQGLENAPEAFARLMRGDNVGKSIVVVSEEPT